MKKNILFSILILIVLNGFCQSYKNYPVKPYFRNNVKIEDSLIVEGNIDVGDKIISGSNDTLIIAGNTLIKKFGSFGNSFSAGYLNTSNLPTCIADEPTYFLDYVALGQHNGRQLTVSASSVGLFGYSNCYGNIYKPLQLDDIWCFGRNNFDQPDNGTGAGVEDTLNFARIMSFGIDNSDGFVSGSKNILAIGSCLFRKEAGSELIDNVIAIGFPPEYGGTWVVPDGRTKDWAPIYIDIDSSAIIFNVDTMRVRGNKMSTNASKFYLLPEPAEIVGFENATDMSLGKPGDGTGTTNIYTDNIAVNRLTTTTPITQQYGGTGNWYENEFFHNLTNCQSQGIGSGTGSVVSTTYSQENHPGLYALNSHASTANSGQLYYQYTTKVYVYHEHRSTIYIADTSKFFGWMGFQNFTNDATRPTDGCYFYKAAGAKIKGCVSSGSSHSYSATYLIKPATWYTYYVEVTASNSVTFRILEDDGTEVYNQTISASIPTAESICNGAKVLYNGSPSGVTLIGVIDRLAFRFTNILTRPED